jgi:hypothetical protein
MGVRVETEATLWQVKPVDVVIFAVLVQFFGMYVTSKVRSLRDFYIPPAVTGGLICSTIVALIYVYGGIEIRFDLQIRDLLLLVFFSTIGLSAKLRRFSGRVEGRRGHCLCVAAHVGGTPRVGKEQRGALLASSMILRVLGCPGRRPDEIGRTTMPDRESIPKVPFISRWYATFNAVNSKFIR